jgi:hypothetical protein
MKVSPGTKVPDPTGIFVPEYRSTQPNGYIFTCHANKEIGPLPSISSNNYVFSTISIQITTSL